MPEPVHAADGRPVTLRAATAADEETMYAWQLLPETRRFSRHPEQPTREEHHRWMRAKLADPQSRMFVIEHDGSPAGVLRLDGRDDIGRDAYEVSILVDPCRHRLGIARAALALARALVPRARLVAEVLPGNDASLRLFLGAGYRAEGPWLVSAP